MGMVGNHSTHKTEKKLTGHTHCIQMKIVNSHEGAYQQRQKIGASNRTRNRIGGGDGDRNVDGLWLQWHKQSRQVKTNLGSSLLSL